MGRRWFGDLLQQAAGITRSLAAAVAALAASPPWRGVACERCHAHATLTKPLAGRDPAQDDVGGAVATNEQETTATNEERGLSSRSKFCRKNLVDDDDSEAYFELQPPSIQVGLLRVLSSRSASAEEVEWLQSKTSRRGVGLCIDGLQELRLHSIPVSTAMASVMTLGVRPADSKGLHSGRLVPLQSGNTFALETASHSDGASSSLRLLVSGGTYFNFILQQWQPLTCLDHYLQRRKVLYCAFKRALHGHGVARLLEADSLGVGGASAARSETVALHRGALFVKVGYYSFGRQEDDVALVRYLEKKSNELKLTNVRGAGFFILQPPRNHRSLADPARAGEASLKAALRTDSGNLKVVPTGHRGDLGTFSASLEYFWVSSRSPDVSPLQALTSALRAFSGDPKLAPRRAVAREQPHERRSFAGLRIRPSLGGLGKGRRLRGGRKHLENWRQEVDGAFELPLNVTSAELMQEIPTTKKPATPLRSQELAQGGGLRTRYAAAADARARRLSTPRKSCAAAKRRRLCSAP